MKTVVYIDGFNFYYSIKDSEYKWLDLVKFMQLVLGEKYQIDKIHYFIARVKPQQNDLQAPQRQQAYIQALEKLYPKKIKIHYGHFLQHHKKMPLAKNPAQKAEVIKTEEKGSDVNLSVHFLNDAWLNHYECGVMVTNDSDMQEAMKLVKEHFPDKFIGLVTPAIKSSKKTVRTSNELKKHSDFVRSLTKGALQEAQLPDKIPNSNIHKPPLW